MDVAVVIPSYKVCASIVEVLEQIGPEVTKIYVVDDACPDGSGRLVENHCSDRRVTVLYHSDNQGVGGAVITGYRAALADNMDIIVKVDGDGQMDPSLIPCFIAPIIAGEADYTESPLVYQSPLWIAKQATAYLHRFSDPDLKNRIYSLKNQ